MAPKERYIFFDFAPVNLSFGFSLNSLKMLAVRRIHSPREAKKANRSAKIPTIGCNKFAAPPMEMKKKRIPNEKTLFFFIVHKA
jgi:hypothetical protein